MMESIAAKTTVLCVFLIFSVTLSSVRAQSPIATLFSVDDEPEDTPDSRQNYCDTHCSVEALSGEKPRRLARACRRRCPDHIVPDDAMDPNALCTNCPLGDDGKPKCSLCLCRTGSCAIPRCIGCSPVNAFTCSHCNPKNTCKGFWWC